MKVVKSSPPKRKLQRDKKGSSSSNEDLDTSDKHNDNAIGKSNFKNSSVFDSASKEEHAEKRSPNKKKTKTVDLFEERIEKKKQRAILYEKYLHRGGARNPGSKEIPTVRKFIYAYKIYFYRLLRLRE